MISNVQYNITYAANLICQDVSAFMKAMIVIDGKALVCIEKDIDDMIRDDMRCNVIRSD